MPVKYTLDEMIAIAIKNADLFIQEANRRALLNAPNLRQQLSVYQSISYSVVVSGKEIAHTVFPRFGVKNQTGKRLESLALLDLKIYQEKYGSEMKIRFFGYKPKSSKLRAKLYKPAQPLPLVK